MALMMMNTQTKNWGDRLLAKLTHDIQQEIEVTYAKGREMGICED